MSRTNFFGIKQGEGSLNELYVGPTGGTQSSFAVASAVAGKVEVQNINKLTASHARINTLDVVTINSIQTTKEDLNISASLIVASDGAAASDEADGSGLFISGANASLTWNESRSALSASHTLEVGNKEKGSTDVLQLAYDRIRGPAAEGQWFIQGGNGVTRIDIADNGALKLQADNGGMQENAVSIEYEGGQSVLTMTGEIRVSNNKFKLGGTTVTSTAAELNILDGVTSTAAELNILDGVTSTTAELNILDGVTSTTAELNILDGVTSTATELNLVDGSTAGTVVNSKAVVYGSSGEVNATTLQIGGSSITATAGELNLLDGDTAVGSSITIADSDGFIVNDGGTMKTIPASDIKTFAAGALSSSNRIYSSTGVETSGYLKVTGSATFAGAASFNGNAQFDGDLDFGTNSSHKIRNKNNEDNIELSTANTDVTMGGNLVVTTDVRVNGNNIKDAGGTAALTFDGSGNTDVNGTLAASGHITLDNTKDLLAGGTDCEIGSEGTKFAAGYFTNVYTGDMHLKNERGDWTIFEEADHLRIRNNLTGQTFKMGMTLIDE
jgi:hypothetical protein